MTRWPSNWHRVTRSADALSESNSGLSPDKAGAASAYEKAVRFARRIKRSSPEWDEAQNIFASASALLSAQRQDRPGLEKALALARQRQAEDPANVARAAILAKAESLANRGLEGQRTALALAEKVYQSHLANESAQRLYFDWVLKLWCRRCF